MIKIIIKDDHRSSRRAGQCRVFPVPVGVPVGVLLGQALLQQGGRGHAPLILIVPCYHHGVTTS